MSITTNKINNFNYYFVLIGLETGTFEIFDINRKKIMNINVDVGG